MRRRVRPRARLTKIGLWFCLFCVVLAIAGANTGNNSLLMVFAALVSLLIVSWFAARRNLNRLQLVLEAPAEVFAGQPAILGYRFSNLRWLVPSFDLLFGLGFAAPAHVARLSVVGRTVGEIGCGSIETMWPRRGRAAVPRVSVVSFFPFGFFRASVDVRSSLDLVVFPELFEPGALELEAARGGEGESPERGRGTDLHSLRPFLTGDDPRAIHWKQSAKAQGLIFRQAAAEESLRVSVVLDEAGGVEAAGEHSPNWERLVSETATACVDFLNRGFAVELVTRRCRIGFAHGRRQRQALLGELALIEPAAPAAGKLWAGDAGASVVRFSLDPNRHGESNGLPETHEEGLQRHRLERSAP